MTDAPCFAGGCLCGDIRFEAQGQPSGVSTCHCRSCQHSAGADSVAWAEFPVSSVKWSGAAPAPYRSSKGVVRSFCTRCGSSLSYRAKDGFVDLVLATFDNPESLVPEREIWLEDRLSWNVCNPDIPGHRQWSSTDSEQD